MEIQIKCNVKGQNVLTINCEVKYLHLILVKRMNEKSSDPVPGPSKLGCRATGERAWTYLMFVCVQRGTEDWMI